MKAPHQERPHKGWDDERDWLEKFSPTGDLECVPGLTMTRGVLGCAKGFFSSSDSILAALALLHSAALSDSLNSTHGISLGPRRGYCTCAASLPLTTNTF